MARPLSPDVAQILRRRINTFGIEEVAVAIARLSGGVLKPHVVSRRLHRLSTTVDAKYTEPWWAIFDKYGQESTLPPLVERMNTLLRTRPKVEMVGRLVLHATRVGLKSPHLYQVCQETIDELLLADWRAAPPSLPPLWEQAIIGLLAEYGDAQPTSLPQSVPNPLHCYLVKFDKEGHPMEASEVEKGRNTTVLERFADGTTAVRLSAPSLMGAINEAQVEVDYARG